MVTPLLLAALLLNQTPNVATAPETVGDELRRAINEYHYGNYESAIEQLEGLLYPMRLNTDDQFIEARKYLSLSYYLTDQLNKVSEEFAKLLYINPDYELDPFAVPPPIIETFEAIRKQLKSELDIIRERKEEKERNKKTQGLTLRTIERTLVEQSQIATLLPFGAGQFQNGDAALGTVFLVTELALLGVNIGSYLYSLTLDNYNESERTTLGRITLAQYASLALFGVSWSIGVFQARLNFIPRYSRPPRVTEESLKTSNLHGILQLQMNF